MWLSLYYGIRRNHIYKVLFVVAQAVSRYIFIAEHRVRSQVSPCGIGGGKKVVLGQGFLRILLFFIVNITSSLFYIH
jgi:hypothetical protein